MTLKNLPSLVAGSAVSAIGFSLGRDVYKTTKGNASNAVIGAVLVALAALPIFATFMAARAVFRNYKTVEEGLLYRVVSVSVALIALILLCIPMSIASVVFFMPVSAVFGWDPQDLGSVPGYMLSMNDFIFDSFMMIAGGEPLQMTDAGAGQVAAFGTFVSFLLFLGASNGLQDRRSRRLAWEAEAHNARFMKAAGISEAEDGTIVDRDGNRYRPEGKSGNAWEWFAIGRRNRRAYVYIDKNGKIQGWSGLVTKGDLRKVKVDIGTTETAQLSSVTA